MISQQDLIYDKHDPKYMNFLYSYEYIESKVYLSKNMVAQNNKIEAVFILFLLDLMAYIEDEEYDGRRITRYDYRNRK